jgi:hypothetical protein
MENGNFKHVFLGTMILVLQTYKKCGRDVQGPQILKTSKGLVFSISHRAFIGLFSP